MVRERCAFGYIVEKVRYQIQYIIIIIIIITN
jgi:hypothetical protein